MANEEHLRVFGYGAKLWNEWRKVNREVKPDLRNAGLIGIDIARADLSGADLSGAKLCEATLISADLRETKLMNVDLREADLTGSNLKNSDLQAADLSGIDLTGANLTEANFANTDLRWADFSSADLSGIDITEATLGYTKLMNVDLGSVKGMNMAKHHGPSMIGIDTIYRSKGNISVKFLREAGVPENLITFMGSLVGAAFEFYSCFISYAHNDLAFAKRLHADLQDSGVRCWFAPEDLKIGQRLRPSFDEAIRLHDKLMVILSESSVKSQWVETEVETAFERERREDRIVLFPIRLDDAVMETQEAWATDIRRMRHIGDFRGWKNHDSYKRAFERLLRDLREESKAKSAAQK